MTAIVGIETDEGVWIAGDSLASDTQTGSKVLRTDTKVFKLGDFLIGFTGSYRLGQIIKFNMDPTPYRSKDGSMEEFMVNSFVPEIRKALSRHDISDTKIAEEAFEVLVGHRGKLWHIQTDLSVAHHQNRYDSIGSGSDFAAGSLHTSMGWTDPVARINCALESAAAWSAYVAPPWIILFQGV